MNRAVSRGLFSCETRAPTLLTSLAAGSVAVPLVILMACGCPTWLWLLLTLGLLTTTALIGRQIRGQRATPPVKTSSCIAGNVRSTILRGGVTRQNS